MTPDRFTDKGQTIYDFSGEILVRCPECYGPAMVTGSGRLNTEDVRLGCTRCGHGEVYRGDETWRGGWQGIAVGRCVCGRDVERMTTGKTSKPASITCRVCQEKTTAAYQWSRLQLSAASDPHFGLSLWLTADVRGRELWAYNAEHLAFLKLYIAADLRERQPGINQSVASRLPRWLKDAKMREPVLKRIKALEETLPA